MPAPKRDAMGRILRDPNGIVYAADEQTRAVVRDLQALQLPEVKNPEPRLWQLHIPAPLEWRAHKGTGRMYLAAKWANANHHYTPLKRNRLTQEWREAAMNRAVVLGLPQNIADRVFVEAFIHMETGRSYDAQNLYPTAKACVDGLVTGKGRIKGYGLIPDDSNRHMVGPICLPGIKYERPGITLRIHTIPRDALYPNPYRPYIDASLELK
jgi:crossover junction endodeoxyribonuclease RusA